MTTATVTTASPATGPTRTALPVLAAGVTMLLWASAFIAIRAVGEHYSPGAMALGRLAVGSVVLSLVAAIRRPRIPRGRTLGLLVAYGVAWFALYTVSLNAAERHLDAGTAALLVNLGPILIAVLAGVYLHEGFPRGLVTGIVIAFAGVLTITFATSTGERDLTGVLLAVASAGLYAVGVLLQKRALAGTQPLPATWLGCLAGALACLPFAPALVSQAAQAPVSATLGIVYMGVFPTATAFLTWTYALSHTNAGRLATSSYVVPALAVLLSWLLLGEVPAPLAFVGGALCLVGVAVSRLPARTRVGPSRRWAAWRQTLGGPAPDVEVDRRPWMARD
ncbi:MAG TPA: DMT family transporter [Micromonosporaceae bacterium]|jgi:drug/metabolite transporter (DMT)-like permease